MDAVTPCQSLPAPTADEKSLAMLSHLLMIFAGFIPPLVIYLIKRDSKFVAFHALQGLLWHAVMFILYFFGFIGLMVSMFTSLLGMTQRPNGPHAFPVVFFSFFVIFGGLFFLLWVTNMVLGIVYCIKANHGEWAAYPLIGRWAGRMVGV